ncbi:putative transcription initiation factor [Rosellinia necatrix]|uniref:Putative transcription initiation factor n=1 Tax=Rosellinia necatrix TaxID=77044 RepID=A0A1W2TJV5_ROSNE|nr:putative transcription initiation factor [Rosellinia necatrix]
MSLEVIYVVRHGFRSSWSVDHITGTYTSYLRSPTGLPTDPALTSHGVEQADELAAHLVDLDPPIDQVYSSPYYRCLQTISPFTLLHNAEHSESSPSNSVPCSPLGIRVELGLSEWYGQAHFEHPTSASLDKLNTLFANLDMNYDSSPGPRRRGESIPQLYQRVASCMQAIVAQCDKEGKKAVLISTHAAVVIVLGRVLTANIPEDVSVEDFRAFTCGLCTYRRQGGGQDCSIPTVTDISRDRARKYKDVQGAVPSAGTHLISRPLSLGRLAVDPWGPGESKVQGLSQKHSIGLSSHWTCEANSDCSFLRGGEERGWKFSGDESFVEVGREGLPLSTLESDPNSAVEKDGDGFSSKTNISKL